jgi:hypothetical protein
MQNIGDSVSYYDHGRVSEYVSWVVAVDLRDSLYNSRIAGIGCDWDDLQINIDGHRPRIYIRSFCDSSEKN